ncbi:uncharacterized protein N7477_004481 [Penicillium maclennaniae]|uniref:uncharacterized protein n=1 Tax=Penicillium maclennaniae TaxID=1343394 RepID=UPI0025417446|nr:uncharacterized protein N7477_004481 [Penicillium maclennaniae]KAJ5674547.1 hypothetical protein N7477_004481 [Penicillium maclennaniae]
MPKPRHVGVDAPLEDESARPALKNRSVTDPISTHDPFQSDSCTPEDMKKKSKLDLIKSKLSFKDLRKEVSLEDIRVSPPMPKAFDLPTPPLNENSRRAFHFAASPNTIPPMAQSNYNFKAKLKPIDQGNLFGCTSQSSTAPSKIPLPPSGTYTNAHGIVVPSRNQNRRVSSAKSQSSSTTQDSTQSKSSAEHNTGATGTVKRRPKKLVLSRTCVDISQSSSVFCRVPNHQSNKISPPMPRHLSEVPGKTRYQPRNWAERDCGPSVPPKENIIIPIAYKENKAPVTCLPDYIPSFRERMEKVGLPLEEIAYPSRSIPMQVDDLVDMVHSIQRHTNLGINNLNNKLDELANWISDQLQKQVTSISDLARAKADLNSKQLEVSKEIMKFQMECRLEVGVMERRLNNFEMKVMDEAQAEIRALVRSYEDLNCKTENLINEYSSHTIQKFIACQHRKNEEVQKDITYLKAQDEKYKLDETQKEQVVRCVKAPMDAAKLPPSSCSATPNHSELLEELPAISNELEAPKGHIGAPSYPSMNVQRFSESTFRSTPPLITEHDRDCALSLAPTPASDHTPLPLRPRVSSAQDHKPAGTLPRSISLTKKGFMTGPKVSVSNVPDHKEKQLENTPSNAGKKRSFFGFLHRRDHHENIMGRHSRSSLRRTEGALLLDDGSSRTSTPTPPIPAIPRKISELAGAESVDI